MRIQAAIDRFMERICDDVARYKGWRRWLNAASQLMVRPVAAAPSAFAEPMLFVESGADFASRLQTMKKNTYKGAAPTDPGALTIIHNTDQCSPLIYHGMHGTPCKYHGGTDKQCPTGTVAGYYWSYSITGIGVVYYVDCCGGRDNSSPVGVPIWCAWTSEENWCGGSGKDIYTCTLAITEAEFVQDSSGKANPQMYAGKGRAGETVKALQKIIHSWYITDEEVKKMVAILDSVQSAEEMARIREALSVELWYMNSLEQKEEVRKALNRTVFVPKAT